MTNEKKLQMLKEWLIDHNAEGVGDKVYDGCATITKLNKGYLDRYFVELRPIRPNTKIGAGFYGDVLLIEF